MVMARIYTQCGRYDEAIDEIDNALSLEAELTPHDLKLTFWIDPLRDNPRYKEMIRKYMLSDPQQRASTM